MSRDSERAVTGLVVVVEAALLLLAEMRSPLRPSREARRLRLARNGALGGLALAATAFLETPLVMRVAAATERRRWGLLPALRLSRPVEAVTAIVLLDYGMYAWHALLHRVPALWRLHLVHHVDRDLDVTTATRIHAAEIALSAAVHVAQVVVLGITPREFALWQRLFACSVMFAHANVRLPAAFERLIGTVIVTPRLHGIHHLARRDAQHGNWSSGLVLWDRLHGTLRDGDASGDVGVPAYAGKIPLSVAGLLALPFVFQPDPWRGA